MAGSFADDARFLAYTRPVEGPRIWLMVPAWAHRVTAPLLKSRGLDLFQRVIIGLSQAGVRQPDRVGTLTGLHPRLCSYIMEQARAQGLLDKSGEATSKGLLALRTGIINDETEWSVRYVFTDPVTGDLWPRAPERLEDAYVLKVSKTSVTIQLGTAGHPVKAEDVLRVPVEDERPKPPRPEQVIEAVHRDRQARETAQHRALEQRYNLRSVPESPAEGYGRVASGELLPELTRISFIAEPEPVEILAAIEVARSDAPGPGWVAHDPFGIGTNSMFGDLVLTLAADIPKLAEQLERMTGQREAEFAAGHKKERQRAGDRAEEILVREYGAELRSDDGLLKRLIEARLAQMDESPGKAMHATFTLFEELMFRLCVAYPVSAEDKAYLHRAASEERQNSAAGRRPRSTASNIAGKIRHAAQSIGAYHLPYTVTSARATELAKIAKDGQPAKGTKYGTLVAVCLFAAARHGDHPLRELISRLPTVLNEIDRLRDDRNAQEHRLGARTVAEDLRWCLDLERLAVPTLLHVPAAP
jgi:hypothetical protein